MLKKLYEAAHDLGLKEYTMRQLIRRGQVPAALIGGKYYLDVNEVKNHLRQMSLQNLQAKADRTE